MLSSRHPRRFGPDCALDGLPATTDVALSTLRAEEHALLLRVLDTVELLNESNGRSRLDVAGIKRGLEMAQECYHRLEGLSRAGRGTSPDLRHIFQELLRSTLETYPVLLHHELEQRARGTFTGPVGDAA